MVAGASPRRVNVPPGDKEIFEYPEHVKVLEEKETRVVQVEPEVEVLHPETYQSTQTMNEPDRDLEIDEKINVVVSDGVWIV